MYICLLVHEFIIFVIVSVAKVQSLLISFNLNKWVCIECREATCFNRWEKLNDKLIELKIVLHLDFNLWIYYCDYVICLYAELFLFNFFFIIKADSIQLSSQHILLSNTTYLLWFWLLFYMECYKSQRNAFIINNQMEFCTSP